jgi:hypothetical protein
MLYARCKIQTSGKHSFKGRKTCTNAVQSVNHHASKEIHFVQSPATKAAFAAMAIPEKMGHAFTTQ